MCGISAIVVIVDIANTMMCWRAAVADINSSIVEISIMALPFIGGSAVVILTVIAYAMFCAALINAIKVGIRCRRCFPLVVVRRADVKLACVPLVVSAMFV